MEAALPPIQDQRGGKRFTLVLRAAKLVAPGGEFLCVLRDVSEGGVKLRLFHTLPTARPLEIELGNGLRHAVEPVWQRGDTAGFRFVRGPVMLTELLGMAGPFPRRGVRLRAKLPVTVSGLDGTHAATLRDISLDGARIDCALPHPLAARLVIQSSRLPAIPGRVRWRSGAAHGLAFERHFALDELARLLGPDCPVPSAKTSAR
jgi:hypothetical protein